MTVYRRNPLLMTVMGANPGPRRKRPADDPIDHAIGQAWHRLMSGIQVSVMDIPRIFRDVKLEMAAGMPLEEAVMRVGARFQVNRNGYRRNPSLAASLAGGLAGAFVTHAMSNPFHIRPMKKLRVGERVEIMHGSGIYSGQQAVVSAPFGWQEETGAYKPVPRGWVYLRTLNGTPFTMPRNRVRSIDPRTETMSNPGPAFIVIDSASGVVQYRRAASGTGDIAFRACYARAVDMANKLGRPFLVFLDIGGHKVGARMSLPMVRIQGATEVGPGGYSGRANPRKSSPKKIRRPSRPQMNPGRASGKRKITMTIEQFAKWVKAKRDPVMWRAFLAKFKGYEKWTHGSRSRKVTVEWQNVPGVDGLWITYDGGKQPESTYIMPKGSKRKGAWKHPWDTMPDIKHDPEAGVVLTKLRGRSKITDFYHR